MQIKKYPHKNLNKNRIIYFQLGLCAILIILLFSVEWKTYAKPVNPEEVKYQEIVFEEMLDIKIPEKMPEKTVVKKPKETIQPTEPNENEETEKKKLVIKAPKKDFNPDSLIKIIEPPVDKPIPDIPFVAIQDVPIFPGCEVYKENDERRDCMQEKLGQFIGKHFDTQIANRLGLEGKHVIYTRFKISHTGEVIFMDGRNPNPQLVKEAERVINKLPKMIPGKQREVPVNVIFGLPINFEVFE